MIITNRINTNSAKMQLIRNFFMQDLLWLPSSTSKDWTMLGEDWPQIWRRSQLWQDSGPTCPAGVASTCSMVQDQAQHTNVSSLRNYGWHSNTWIKIKLVLITLVKLNVHVSFLFLLQNKYQSHKGLIFLWFL